MRNHARCLTAGVALLVVAGLGTVGDACFMRSPLPVQVWLDHIQIDIVDQVAVKTYNCTFRNTNRRAVVGGECFMELEPGAQVDNMSVTVDGKEMHAEVLDVEKAKKVFQDIVRRGGSPALLEFYGSQLIRTKVPRVPAGGTVTVKLTYTTVLPRRGGLVRLQMLNTNPKALQQPLKSASVTVNIKSREAIKNVYSPTHKIRLEEKKGWDVSVQWKQDNYLPKHPFVLYYQLADKPVGASLIAHREPGEDGAFMLLLSPTIGQGTGRIVERDVLPKDVVFCVDTSGSMLEGNKMEQARAALEYCVKHLRAGDRFNIVDFSTEARRFDEAGLVEVNDRSRARALAYVGRLRARGGTAIQEALDTSLRQFADSDRLKMVLFATDGLPTIGERRPVELLKEMTRKNTRDVRMFVFGEGFDVNTRLLDFLAIDHRGEADYILPDEDIAEKISRFFDRVGSPVMTDLEISFEGIKVRDVYPRRVADVYRGEQIAVFGRYQGSGRHTVTVTGMLRGKRQKLRFEVTFPDRSNDDRSAFVPRLWAGRKVSFLIGEIRKSDRASDELVDEVTRLAKRYGIVTPYTSYLMAEDIVTAPMPVVRGRFRAQSQRLDQPAGNGKLSTGPSATARREANVRVARSLADSRKYADRSGNEGASYDKAEEALRAHGRNVSALSVVRYIGARTFYKSGATWYDSRYDAQRDGPTVRPVRIGSDEYFELLSRDSRLAKYLALGDVVLQVERRWVKFHR